MMLLRRVEGVDGGERGFALVGGRAVGLLSLGGFVLVGRHGGRMGGWASSAATRALLACLLTAASAALVSGSKGMLRCDPLLIRCGEGEGWV